jgi:hypothetical protein
MPSPIGYSGTPLVKKLGYQSGMKAYLHHPPRQYRDLLAGLPEGVSFSTRLGKGLRLVHVFVTERGELESILSRCLPSLKPDGIIWVSWPKKSSEVATDVTEDVIRDVALPLGLVDVKVCAVDEVWSGLKLVIRKKLRGKLPNR